MKKVRNAAQARQNKKTAAKEDYINQYGIVGIQHEVGVFLN